MKRIYYKKANKEKKRKVARFTGLGISTTGFCIVLYIFTPLLSWQLFSAPIFLTQKFLAPIPQMTVVNGAAAQTNNGSPMAVLSNGDSTNAADWFPQYSIVKKVVDAPPKVSSYTLTIPKIKVFDAAVTTVDNDLAKHLVNFDGTAVPPDKGTAVIFGHSTLPQLFDPSNYRTILANAYKLEVGDQMIVTVNNVSYTYKVFSITVVEPDDTSVFTQNYDDSHISLITCTPPGTLWHRLVVQARLEQ